MYAIRSYYDVKTLTITVTPVNDAPVIMSVAPDSAHVGVEYRYEVDATDVDNDTLYYSLVDAPEGMTVAEDGVISWIPVSGTNSSGIVTLMVSDGSLVASEAFTIAVNIATGIFDVRVINITLFV